MKNSMESGIRGTEAAPPSFLEDFVRKVDARVKEMLLNQGIREHFTYREANRHVHPGNVSDILRNGLQLTTRASKSILLESRQQAHGSREDLHHQETLEKVVEYYELKEGLLSLYAEAKDDPRLAEFVLVVEQDMPCLKGTYEAYAKGVKKTN